MMCGGAFERKISAENHNNIIIILTSFSKNDDNN
jgi:hypothetical protein